MVIHGNISNNFIYKLIIIKNKIKKIKVYIVYIVIY